jgi:hypothetical protein
VPDKEARAGASWAATSLTSGTLFVVRPEPEKSPLHHDGESATQRDERHNLWVALSVTTVGALLASIQGSALLIALPNILASLDAQFLTIMWVLLSYLLITTACVTVVGRLADTWGRKKLFNAGFAVFTLGADLPGPAE